MRWLRISSYHLERDVHALSGPDILLEHQRRHSLVGMGRWDEWRWFCVIIMTTRLPTVRRSVI